jgi:hypothetical protein
VDGVDVQVAKHLPQKLLLVGGVVDREVRLQSDRLGPSAEDAGAEAVKGADPDTAAGEQIGDAGGHLVGRLVREGDRQDVAGIDAPLDQPGDAAGDYARFSTFASELVHRKSAVIVVTTIRAAQEAKRATSTILLVSASEQRGSVFVWDTVTGKRVAGLPDGSAWVRDRDRDGRLLEDYWHDEWPTVVEDFREMKALGANVVRVHLQLGRFMAEADRPHGKNLARLGDLVRLADETGLYLYLTGLGCYHRADVPPWYDR